MDPGTTEPEPETEPETQGELEPYSEDDSASLYYLVTCYSIVILLIIVINSVITAAVLRGKLHRHNPINIYLLSLVLSRMCVGVLVVPAHVTGLFSEKYLGSVLCKACHFFATGSSVSSILSTVTIAIIKYREIVLKKGQISISSRRAAIDVCLIWVCGHIYAIRALIFNDLTYLSDQWKCGVVPEHRALSDYFIFVDLVVVYVFPLSIVCFSYVKVMGYLKRESLKSVGFTNITSSTTTIENETESDTRQPEPPVKDLKKIHVNKRSIQMIVTVVCLFGFCTFMPYIPKMYAFWNDEMFENFDMAETAAYVISYSNPWLNGIVILAFREDIRKVAKLLLTGDCCRAGQTDGTVKDLLKTMALDTRDIMVRSN